MFPKSLDSLYVARTLTIGAAAATIFGTLWVVQGINASHAPAQVALPLFAAQTLLALGMAVACIRLFTTARLFTPDGDQGAMKQADRYINIATVVQIVASVVGPALLTLWGRANLALPVTIVSVGLFMLALAPILRIPHYALVGALLCVLPIVSVLCVPATIMVAGGEMQSWTVINGIACGLINLGSGCMNILLTIRIRRGQYRENRPSQEVVIQRLASTQPLIQQ
ncbi:hypothetical protein KSF_076480 [Reticulibacter mediterranei]|uniref:Uncharacterized protein n=1 Tax=Reticulibacter mediterranei TaxID=2778369 RepID=A0A8J3N6N2_9CHLR|nr:hypothetical protein [Reticulibacter mediterranei]GHO97600.1 hypothetical protein KSF_076480 [Reticulibacter mediterranei]